MKYQISKIEERVYALLDENLEIIDERVEYGDPGMSPAALIRMLLPDAAEIVLSTIQASDIEECQHLLGEANIYKVSPDDTSTVVAQLGAVTHDSDGRAVMKLPDGFLRLLYFKMSDWSYGVREPLAFDGESYRLRCANNARGSRRRTRPGVSIRHLGEDKYLEIFGTTPGAITSMFEYLTKPEITDEYADLPLGTFSAVCDKLAEMIKAVI